MTDTSNNSLTDIDGDTTIDISNNNTIVFNVENKDRLYFDNSGIRLMDTISFYDTNSKIDYNNNNDRLDINGGTNGILFNNNHYVLNDKIGIKMDIFSS